MKSIFTFIFIIRFFLAPGFIYSQTDYSGSSFVFAQKLYDDKMYDLAAEQFHQFAEQNPNNPKAAEALYLAGLSYFNIKEYQKARKEFLYLILRFPDAKDMDRAQFKVAECFQALGEISAAANAYRQVQVFYLKSPLAEQALFMSAQMLFDDKQFEKATEILYEFLEVYPISKLLYDAKLLITESFIGNKDYDRAQIEIDKILATTDFGYINAKAMLMKANLSYQSRHFQQAERDYQKLIDKYANSRNAKDQKIISILNRSYYDLSEILNLKGMHEKSNEYLYKISDYETNSRILFLMGENHFSLGSYSQAIDVFQKIISIPDSNHLIQAYLKLGNSYYALKDYVNAVNAFKNGLQLCQINNPNNSGKELCKIMYIKISEAYLNLNQPDVAISYLKKYRSTTDKNEIIEIIDYRIAYLYETKVRDFERAIRAYYDFIDSYPHSKFIDEAKLGLAGCYENNGNYTQALVEYNNFITFYPASEHFSEVKNRIDYLKNYYQVESVAIRNLSGVVKQLAENQTNEIALYQLGLTYFRELKDYETSISLFNKIDKSPETTNIPRDELLFYRGRAFQLLGEKMMLDSQEQSAYLDSAEYDYNLLVNNFPESSWADDATFHIIEIKALKLNTKDINYFSQMKEALTSFIYKYTESPALDKVAFQLGLLLLQKGLDTSIDSLDIYNNFQRIICDYPQSQLLPEAKYYQTLLLFQTKNFNFARDKFNVFISEYPDHNKTCEAFFQLAKLSELKEDYSTAINFLKQIIIKYYYSNYADSANLIIGSYLTKQQKYSEALAYYMDIYEEYETNNQIFESGYQNLDIFQDVLFRIASILKTTNYRDEAVKFYQKYLIKFPKGKYADQVLVSLGELFNTTEKEEQSKAIDYFQQLETNFSSSDLVPNALINLGDLSFNQEKYDDANQYYSRALNTNLPDAQQAYVLAQIIICLYRSGQISLADERYKEYKKQFRDEKSRQAAILLEKGDYLLKAKNFVEAEKIFKDVRSDFKNTSEGIKADYLLGKLYFILNKDEDALEILTDLIKKYPNSQILSEVYITLGNFYYLQAKQIENAMLAYKNAIELQGISEQNLMIGMHNLIKCYSDLQLWDKAISLSRSYLEKFPIAEDALEKKIQIGYFYFELKEYDYAIQLFKKLKPEADVDNEPRIQFWIGECYFEKGDYQQAISEYLKIAYLSKPAKLLGQYRVTAQYKAAISYLKLGKLDNAKQLFQRIVTEQGAESAFGKPAKEKLEEIERMITAENKDML